MNAGKSALFSVSEIGSRKPSQSPGIGCRKAVLAANFMILPAYAAGYGVGLSDL